MTGQGKKPEFNSKIAFGCRGLEFGDRLCAAASGSTFVILWALQDNAQLS